MITAVDIGWAAGIYEGEGSPRRAVYTEEAKRLGIQNRTFNVAVTQKDTEILHRLKEKFGGAVSPKPDAAGCSLWCLSGDAGRGFLMTIYSLLSKRRQKQARAAGLFDSHKKSLSAAHRQKISESGKRAWATRRGENYGTEL